MANTSNLMNNQLPREFKSLDIGTQQLVLAVSGVVPENIAPPLRLLAENLRRSSVMEYAARRVIEEEGIGINWQDLLDEATNFCLQQLSEELRRHADRMATIIRLELEQLDRTSPDQMDDYGFADFRRMQHFVLTPEEKERLYWAHLAHDVGNMCYPLSFLASAETFTEAQRKQLVYHVQYGYYLGQFLNVHPQVIALIVMHHQPTRGYPWNGILAKLSHYLVDPRFCYMRDWLAWHEVYVGMTDVQAHRMDTIGHEQALRQMMPPEVKEVGMGFAPFLEAVRGSGTSAVALG
jgi:hypothetical protein